MPALPPKGLFCQSCAMPLESTEDFGTATDGSRVSDYCRYCYSSGSFTNPGMSLAAMTQLCVDVMVKRGMPQVQARALMTDALPKLKRWRQTGSPARVGS